MPILSWIPWIPGTFLQQFGENLVRMVLNYVRWEYHFVFSGMYCHVGL